MCVNRYIERIETTNECDNNMTHDEMKKYVIENAIEYTRDEDMTLIERVQLFIDNERDNNRDDIACDNMNDDVNERERDMIEHVEYVYQMFDVLIELMNEHATS